LVQDIATEEQLEALPHYEGESSLADYHYLQLMREPLIFDQLVGDAEYVDEDDKTCAAVRHIRTDVGTAFSNNIMRIGKHYASFQRTGSGNVMVGIMRPGQANQNDWGTRNVTTMFIVVCIIQLMGSVLQVIGPIHIHISRV